MNSIHDKINFGVKFAMKDFVTYKKPIVIHKSVEKSISIITFAYNEI